MLKFSMKGKQFTRFYFKILVGCDNTYYFLEICIAKVTTSGSKMKEISFKNEGELAKVKEIMH